MNEPLRVTPIFGDAREASSSKVAIFWTADRMDFGPTDPVDPEYRPARLARWARLLRKTPGAPA